MTFSPFSSLPVPKPDPLFAIGTEARLAGPAVINGTIGIVMDEQGKPLLFPSVRLAISDLAKELTTLDYSYPKLTGLDSFRTSVAALLPTHKDMHMASIASTGGTGGLAINLRLMRMMLGDNDPAIILPVPAWGNHPPPCIAAGLRIIEVPYLVNGIASIDGILEAVAKEQRPVGVLLQVGCHNPTGLDFSSSQWQDLAQALANKNVIALLDFAYQGFIAEPEDDAKPIELFLQNNITSLVVWSASKNHTIYGLRTGLAAAYVPSEELIAVVEGHYSTITRMLHSASATFGQHIVAQVQANYMSAWRQDLLATRTLVDTKRAMMTKLLPEPFQVALRGHGMFAMLPLTSDQILRLKTDHAVYMTLDGRLNIAGIPEVRVGELCEKIQNTLL